MITISVITATFNRSDVLSDCLESVRSQTYPSIQHVIIDGDSVDGTKELVKKYARDTLKFISEKDYGIYDALNKGIKLSCGDVIGFLHSDDVFFDSQTVQNVAKAFSNKDVSVVYGDLEYVAKNDLGRVIRRWNAGRFVKSSLRHGWMPPHPTLFVRREIYETVGCFDPSFRISGDYHSILKIFSQADIGIAYLPIVMTKMRIGGASNRSLINLLQKMREDKRALEITRSGGLGTVLMKNIRKMPQFL